MQVLMRTAKKEALEKHKANKAEEFSKLSFWDQIISQVIFSFNMV